MTKLFRWVVQHKLFVSVMLCIILCGFFTLDAVSRGHSIAFIIVLNLLLIFVSFFMPQGLAEKLMLKAIKPLNNHCDPYPLLQETEMLLQYITSGLVQQELQINRCLALSEIGEFQKALEIMTSINIDKHAGMPTLNKYVYYNNLAYFSENLGDIKTANLWNQKAKQIYNDIKNSRVKRHYAQHIQFSTAEEHYKNNEYTKALEILRGMTPEHARRGVEIAMLQGMIYRTMDDVENAKANFAYVIRNGNKLHKVTIARQYLIELQNK